MSDLDILARTLYGEAESNNEADARAIASVIVNRTKFPNWPNDVSSVCLQPWQFSCWNAGDPNRERIQAASGAWFEKCKKIAGLALAGDLTDITHRATHYYETKSRKPKWSKGKIACYSVEHRNGGAHFFFNDIDTPPPVTAPQALEQVKPLSGSRTMRGAQVAASATVLSVAAEAIDKVQPAFPFLEAMAQYAPWMLAALALVGIGYMVYARMDDRAKGYR